MEEQYITQTQIGNRYGKSAVSIGKAIEKIGLKIGRVPDSEALRQQLAQLRKLKDGTEYYVWSVEVIELLEAHGYVPLVQTEVVSENHSAANSAPIQIQTTECVIATDGACIGNPGPGGWAWVNEASGENDSGGIAQTTNNIMELTAVLEAINALSPEINVLIRSDSQYVINVLTKWVYNWERNGWRGANKKPVANRELVQEILQTIRGRQGKVRWEWVRGHAGDAGNEKADQLASAQAAIYQKQL